VSDAGFVYAVWLSTGYWKVGKGGTKKRAYAGSTYVKVSRERFWPMDDMHTAERQAHAALDRAKRRVQKGREWFRGDDVPDLIEAAIGAEALAAAEARRSEQALEAIRVARQRQQAEALQRQQQARDAEAARIVAEARRAAAVAEAYTATRFDAKKAPGVRPWIAVLFLIVVAPIICLGLAGAFGWLGDEPPKQVAPPPVQHHWTPEQVQAEQEKGLSDFELMQQRAASACETGDVCESGQCRPHDSEPIGAAAVRSDDGCQ
jgi:hypothetical protein